ncbi:sodium:calcium antiporter [Rhodohalobacter sp. SW132]|uniref:calcium/sodium antiporter n=1 Tax=Rhodohalobacter sp. SW132 TaxID=2293433 RepID=UPI000E25B657|nr:calcium/sodium antiporter [Rhodohalobacter sp. SW132]REL32883.1 sodium:calcium antiporter [Rhodohalobacter sp. SW132]
MTFVLFLAGLLLLIAGAELLVKGASGIALTFRISPLVVGLTVVSFGTSAPELAVGIQSSLTGNEGITFGTVVGSNIFNILFILGVSALILPLSVSRKLLRLDVPFMIFLSVLLLMLSMNGVLSRVEGIVLTAALIGYTFFLISNSRGKRETEFAEPGETPVKDKGWVLNISMVAGGLGILLAGSGWFLDGAVEIARLAGLSEAIIGLTIVAAGTSMPEVVTSVMAAIRGEREIAVGNVVGSNIFNILGVLGISAMFAADGLNVSEPMIRFDIPVMIAAALACLPIFFTGGVISRGEGLLFLGFYTAYTFYLILAATQHDSLPVFSAVMLWFVIPFTVIILAIVVYQQIISEKRKL